MSRLSDSRPAASSNSIGSGVIGTAAVSLGIVFGAQPLFAEIQRNPLPLVSPPTAPVPSVSTISREVRDVFARAAHAVVKIHGVDEHSDIYGTGLFVDPTGTLYTAYTVGGEAENFSVEFGGKQYPAKQ